MELAGGGSVARGRRGGLLSVTGSCFSCDWCCETVLHGLRGIPRILGACRKDRHTSSR